jgi:YD repeat-containing protein
VQNAAYNAMGQITALPLGNGVTTNYTYYDLNFRLQSIEVPGLLDLAYTYDDVGNVLSITDARNHDQVQSFRYDSLDRLTHAWTTGGGEGAYDRTYTYDEIGNLTFKTDLGTYTYPVSGAESVRPHAVTNTSSGDEFTYDANGNQTLRVVVSGTQVITYVQDFAENRLQSVTVGGHTTKFTYDGDGNRVLRVSPDGTWTAYVGQYYEVSLPPWSAIPGLATGLYLQAIWLYLGQKAVDSTMD